MLKKILVTETKPCDVGTHFTVSLAGLLDQERTKIIGCSGLIADVKADVEEARQANHIHRLAPNNLCTFLVEKTCEAYREVSTHVTWLGFCH
jgi:hypothetical protein